MTKFARFAAAALFLATPAMHAQTWIAPTPEELSMTSLPEVPGASAVYLNREEVNNDFLHVTMYYERIKILTEAGKNYANVEIPYETGEKGDQMDDPTGRTIHPDGTIVPFTGKPYQKLVEKSKDFKVVEKVFTLPSVEVGSIIEYRYRLRYDDNYVQSPRWFIQSDLYTRNAHYLWYPTTDIVTSTLGGEHDTAAISWTEILPAGVKVKEGKTIGNSHPGATKDGEEQFEVTVHDVPPVPHEEFMPPLDSLSYRVLFYYTPFRTKEEFWKAEGKIWSKEQDKFIGPGPGVKDAVQKLVAPSDTSTQKLARFYAAVMALENTDFTRQHTSSEDKAAGLRDVKNTDDILARKRGSSDQLAELFIAMARAAGFKAYAMGVADRKRRIFLSTYLSAGQLDDIVAIVNVDGKEQYFDPGTRYCAFGHIAWRHGQSAGLRQVDGGTMLAVFPGEPYSVSHVTRLANLDMEETGKVNGKLEFTYTGDPALEWRQKALEDDEVTVKKQLRTRLEELLPGGMDVTVTGIQNLTDYNLPLIVDYEVSGGVGAPTGKRLLITGDLFQANAKPIFPEEKRDLPVDMHYASTVQEVVHINLPDNLTIESLPVPGDAGIPKTAVYRLNVEKKDKSYTIRRDLTVGKSIFSPADYPDLRTFYNKLQTKDQESVVLIRSAAVTSVPSGN